MAHHKSAKKRIRQTAKRNAQNRVQKSAARTAVKKVRQAVEAKDKDTAAKALQSVQSMLATLAKKNLFKKNMASRLTSRLSKLVSTIG